MNRSCGLSSQRPVSWNRCGTNWRDGSRISWTSSIASSGRQDFVRKLSQQLEQEVQRGASLGGDEERGEPAIILSLQRRGVLCREVKDTLPPRIRWTQRTITKHVIAPKCARRRRSSSRKCGLPKVAAPRSKVAAPMQGRTRCRCCSSSGHVQERRTVAKTGRTPKYGDRCRCPFSRRHVQRRRSVTKQGRANNYAARRR
jgi:hypothetical protein